MEGFDWLKGLLLWGTVGGVVHNKPQPIVVVLNCLGHPKQ